jgi:hypothetical protein
VALALGIKLGGEPEQLRLGGQAAAPATLGHMDRLMVEHPGEFSAAVAHHAGLNPNGAGGRVPFGRRPPLDRWSEHNQHAQPLQGVDQAGDRPPFQFELRWVAQPFLDLGDREQGVIGAAFVEVADAAVGQRHGPGPPALIGEPELPQQAGQGAGGHHHGTTAGRTHPVRRPSPGRPTNQAPPNQAGADQQGRQAARGKAENAVQGWRGPVLTVPC